MLGLKLKWIVILAFICAATVQAEPLERLVDAPENRPYRLWPSRPPENCPFKPSDAIKGIAFTGRYVNYTNADTWYPSWAADGNYYSPWTDGSVGDDHCFSGGGEKAHTGQAKIVGDDPMDLEITSLGTLNASALPYGGRYPCGSLVHEGVWYYGTYGLMNADYGLNWPILGPCPGFHVSTDYGKTWEKSPHSCKPGDALFPEPDKLGGPVKIGAPHFVDFGKNMEHSPDGKAYLVGHGSTEQDEDDRRANLSWITGDQIYMCRVKPSPENINDESAYEYFAGHDDGGKARWTKDFEDIQPLIDWDNHCGCVTATYNPELGRYLMCITDGWPTIKSMDTCILESEQITGPWRLVSYMEDLGEQAYFVNFPGKFIAADGRTAWLCYAANFTDPQHNKWPAKPPGSEYAMSLHQVRLLGPDEEVTPGPLNDPRNVAREAQVSVTSTYEDYHAFGAVDGRVGGFPHDTDAEWASAGERESAILRLRWQEPVTIERVWLFDRPNDLDQVKAGMLVFSDGSTIKTGELPDDASKGLEVEFEPRKVKWLAFFVTEVKPDSPNIGLSEIAVFEGE